MPFAEPGGHRFTQAGVQKNAPPFSGVYGISNARRWLLVGEADDIQAALLSHLREAGTTLQGHAPTGFTFEICGPGYRLARQISLIQEYHPACNRQGDSKQGE